MTSIMEGVVQRGTAHRRLKMLPNAPIAGKTGTTNDEKDAWFIGYTPDLVVGVFIGYDSPAPMGKGRPAVSCRARLRRLHEEALADKPAVPFRVPPGIKLVRVSLRTGLRAQGGRPKRVIEAFKPGEEPDDAYSVIGFTRSGAPRELGGPPPTPTARRAAPSGLRRGKAGCLARAAEAE